jgi:hypothetical protein
MVEVTEWSRPAILRSDQASDQATHPTPPRRVYPQAVHTAHKFGDNLWRSHGKFVDKPVVALYGPAVHFVLPEGAG